MRSAVSCRAVKTVAESKTFDDDWLKADTTVHLLTLFGWTIPSGIAIKSYGDTSLLAAFTDSIGANLANFPQGPGLEDKFWLYLLTWHIGLFSTMLLGQIGWQGRKQGYFK
jgi:photosystem I subunit PsaO